MPRYQVVMVRQDRTICEATTGERYVGGPIFQTVDAFRGGLHSLLDLCQRGMSREGVLLIDAPVLDHGGPELSDVYGAGWKFRTLDGWTSMTHESGQTVHVGIMPSMRADRVPWTPTDAPESIVSRLVAYHRLLGVPFRMTAGVSGCALLKREHTGPRGKAPYWGVNSVHNPARTVPGLQGQGDIIWGRSPNLTELGMRWVHVWDLTAARLAAINVEPLPWSRLSHTGDIGFDHTIAGYWQIQHYARPRKERVFASMLEARGHVPPLWVANGANGLQWLTTPIMSELVDRGINPIIVDSYTSPGIRWARKWAELVDGARIAARDTYGDPSPELGMIKATYREAPGMWARAGGSIDRPELYDIACDRQRVTVIRHSARIAQATHRTPMSVHTDALYYASDHDDWRDDPITALLRMKGGVGDFHHSRTLKMSDYQDGKRR